MELKKKYEAPVVKKKLALFLLVINGSVTFIINIILNHWAIRTTGEKTELAPKSSKTKSRPVIEKTELAPGSGVLLLPSHLLNKKNIKSTSDNRSHSHFSYKYLNGSYFLNLNKYKKIRKYSIQRL